MRFFESHRGKVVHIQSSSPRIMYCGQKMADNWGIVWGTTPTDPRKGRPPLCSRCKTTLERYLRRIDLEVAGPYEKLLKANYEFLSKGRYEVLELFMDVRDAFDGSEYQQGKKDGLRLTMALLGSPGMASFNRGGGNARKRPAPAEEVSTNA